MNNFLQRSITGTLFVVVIIFGIWYSELSNYILFNLITIFCLTEYFKMIYGNRKVWIIVFSILGFLLFNVVLYTLYNRDIQNTVAIVSLSLVTIASLELIIRPDKTSITIGTKNLWGLLYIALPFALACFFWPDFENQREILLGFFILQWSADTFAYLIGKQFGKTKLARKISPKKTWEGFIGGGILTLLIAFILSLNFTQLSALHWMIIALLVWFFGMVGDLFESRLKRHFGVKDSSSYLPGHGGFLDRFDGILFSMPAAYSYIHFVVL